MGDCMRLVISNRFSLDMFSNPEILMLFTVDADVARRVVKEALDEGITIYSIVDNEEDARKISEILGVNVSANPIQYVFIEYDTLLVVTDNNIYIISKVVQPVRMLSEICSTIIAMNRYVEKNG